MNNIRMMVGLFLGMREIWGSRQFNELPTFVYQSMAPLLGIMVYLLTQLCEPLFSEYLEVLEAQGFAEILTPTGIAVSTIICLLAYVLFRVGLEFAKHCKMLIDRGMSKRNRGRRRK